MADRTVHARYPGMEIVRYDRSGKWYLEPVDGPYSRPGAKRQRVTIHAAVDAAVRGVVRGGEVTLGLAGGSTFDRLVKARG